MPVVGDRGADQRQARSQLRRVRRQAVLDQRPYCLWRWRRRDRRQAAGQQAHRHAEQHDEGQRHGQRRQRVAAQRGEQSRVERPGGDDDDDGEQQRADEGQQHRDAADDQQRDDGELGELRVAGLHARRDLRVFESAFERLADAVSGADVGRQRAFIAACASRSL